VMSQQRTSYNGLVDYDCKSGRWVPAFETKTLLSCYYPDDIGKMFFQNTGINLPNNYGIKTLKITKKLSSLFLD